MNNAIDPTDELVSLGKVVDFYQQYLSVKRFEWQTILVEAIAEIIDFDTRLKVRRSL